MFSLPIPHGMHLVVPTYHYFFWAVYHPSRTFPPKEPEWEPQNRLSSLPTARPYSLLPPTYDPPFPVLVGYRLVMSGPCACSTSVYVQNWSTAYAFAWSRDSFAHPAAHPWLLMLWAIFWFPILYGLLLLGAGLRLIVGFSSFSLLFYSLSSLATILAIPLCHSCCDVIWLQLVGPLWACCLFFSQWLNMVIEFILMLFWAFLLHCLWAPLSHLFLLGHSWPFFFSSVFPWVFTNSFGLP